MTPAAPETAPSDEDLAALVAQRLESARGTGVARSALDQLYRRHSPLLLAFLAAHVRRADLDDIHQDVWQRVWVHLPTQFRGGNFRAWLYQIARNTIIDQSRKRKPESLREHDRLADPRLDPVEQPLIEAEHGAALLRCIDQLDPEAANLVRARLGGEDYAQFCARLGISTNRAYKMMNEAKTKLKTCVERALS